MKGTTMERWLNAFTDHATPHRDESARHSDRDPHGSHSGAHLSSGSRRL
jgi:hypothetical protein